MAKDNFSPTVIEEIRFPSDTQTSGTLNSSGDSSNFYPTQVTPLSFPTANIATGLRSTSFDTELRLINGNFRFQSLGAISIGTVKGTGTSLSGSGIRISPFGIYGYTNGVVKFSLNSSGVFATSGYIQVGGAAADVNSGMTTIAPGKVLISGTTTLSSWSMGADATYIDGGKIYTGSITASKIQTGALVVGTNVGLGTAQDSGGVTTIIGNTVTTDYINAKKVTAEYVVSGISITSPNISGGFLVIGNADNNTFITDISGVGYVGFMSGGNIKGMFRGTSGTRGNGIVIDGGDMVLNNNRSFMIANSGTLDTSKYGGIGITSGNHFWLTTGTSDQFWIKNNAQNVDFLYVCHDYTEAHEKFKAGSGDFTTINNTTLNGNWIGYWTLNYYSDKSLKKDIANLELDFDSLSKLKPIEFKYKEDKAEKKHFGFVAQDLEKVFPNLVSTDKDGKKGTDITQLIPLLVNAINNLNEEVNKLKLKVNK